MSFIQIIIEYFIFEDDHIKHWILLEMLEPQKTLFETKTTKHNILRMMRAISSLEIYKTLILISLNLVFLVSSVLKYMLNPSSLSQCFVFSSISHKLKIGQHAIMAIVVISGINWHSFNDNYVFKL